MNRKRKRFVPRWLQRIRDREFWQSYYLGRADWKDRFKAAFGD